MCIIKNKEIMKNVKVLVKKQNVIVEFNSNMTI